MKRKVCTKCLKEKILDKFSKVKSSKDGYHWWCKECMNKNTKKWTEKDKLEHPWINSYNNAKQRCENPNNPNYPWWGAKGIKFKLTKDECDFIWKRDEADKMQFPTIDRIDNKGNYTFKNCQFLENKENSMKDNVGHWFNNRYIKYTKIGQYSLDGKLIRTWNSQGDIQRTLNISQGDISNCVNGKKVKKVRGFIWKKI